MPKRGATEADGLRLGTTQRGRAEKKKVRTLEYYELPWGVDSNSVYVPQELLPFRGSWALVFRWIRGGSARRG